jgi:hypothetical protein
MCGGVVDAEPETFGRQPAQAVVMDPLHRFFKNLARHVSGRDQGGVLTARAGQTPIVAAVFFTRNCHEPAD